MDFAYISRTSIVLEYLQYLILYACVTRKDYRKICVRIYSFQGYSITLQPYTSQRCTYPAKDTTENAMFQKSTLPNDKFNFKFNILMYSQKSDLFTYFEKRRRVLHNGTALSKL